MEKKRIQSYKSVILTFLLAVAVLFAISLSPVDGKLIKFDEDGTINRIDIVENAIIIDDVLRYLASDARYYSANKEGSISKSRVICCCCICT